MRLQFLVRLEKQTGAFIELNAPADLKSYYLLRALINPRADNADFFGRQRLRRRASLTWPALSATVFSALTSGSSGARTARGFRLGRHRRPRIDAGDGADHLALRAVSGHNDLPFLATFKDVLKGVEPQAAFGALFAVATHAGEIGRAHV